MINLTSKSILCRSFKFCDKFIPDDFSRYASYYMPEDLCTFARSYFYRLVAFSIVIYLISSILIGIPFVYLNVETLSLIIAAPTLLALMLGAVGTVFGTVFGIVYLSEKAYNKLKRKSSSGIFEKFRESIPVQYVNSKLHGYCVPISYNDKIEDV